MPPSHERAAAKAAAQRKETAAILVAVRKWHVAAGLPAVLPRLPGRYVTSAAVYSEPAGRRQVQAGLATKEEALLENVRQAIVAQGGPSLTDDTLRIKRFDKLVSSGHVEYDDAPSFAAFDSEEGLDAYFAVTRGAAQPAAQRAAQPAARSAAQPAAPPGSPAAGRGPGKASTPTTPPRPGGRGGRGGRGARSPSAPTEPATLRIATAADLAGLGGAATAAGGAAAASTLEFGAEAKRQTTALPRAVKAWLDGGAWDPGVGRPCMMCCRVYAGMLALSRRGAEASERRVDLCVRAGANLVLAARRGGAGGRDEPRAQHGRPLKCARSRARTVHSHAAYIACSCVR
jgi:hypothetical protein